MSMRLMSPVAAMLASAFPSEYGSALSTLTLESGPLPKGNSASSVPSRKAPKPSRYMPHQGERERARRRGDLRRTA